MALQVPLGTFVSGNNMSNLSAWGGQILHQLSNLGTFIGPQASIFYPINKNYQKLVVLSVEDDVKHPDREINSASNKVYLTVQCNTKKNKRKNNGNFVMWDFFVLVLLNQ